MTDAEARPTAAELLSSALLPAKLEVEASFLRYGGGVAVIHGPNLGEPIALLTVTVALLRACSRFVLFLSRSHDRSGNRFC